MGSLPPFVLKRRFLRSAVVARHASSGHCDRRRAMPFLPLLAVTWLAVPNSSCPSGPWLTDHFQATAILPIRAESWLATPDHIALCLSAPKHSNPADPKQTPPHRPWLSVPALPIQPLPQQSPPCRSCQSRALHAVPRPSDCGPIVAVAFASCRASACRAKPSPANRRPATTNHSCESKPILDTPCSGVPIQSRTSRVMPCQATASIFGSRTASMAENVSPATPRR